MFSISSFEKEFSICWKFPIFQQTLKTPIFHPFIHGEYVSKQYMRNTSDRADLANFVLFQHGAAKILITFPPQNFAPTIWCGHNTRQSRGSFLQISSDDNMRHLDMKPLWKTSKRGLWDTWNRVMIWKNVMWTKCGFSDENKCSSSFSFF